MSGNSPQREIAGTIGVDRPNVSSGSPTWPLDVAAALSADRKVLTIAVVNPTESEQQIDVTIQGAAVRPQGRLWRIAPADLNPQNAPGKPRDVDIVESAVNEAPAKLALPKLSIYNPQKNTENLIPFSANLNSPDVRDDNTVTFRLRAPEARQVLLSGVAILYALGDVNKPGKGPAYYDARDVPHGLVTRHVYHSKVTNGERELYMYTPPGYDRRKTYPVLYLVGGSGDLPSNWIYDGRANLMMDNLLAEGKVVPMVIAIPNTRWCTAITRSTSN